MERKWFKISITTNTDSTDLLTGMMSSRYEIEGVEEINTPDSEKATITFFIPIDNNSKPITIEDIHSLIYNIKPVYSIDIDTYNYDPAIETEWKKYFKPSLVGKNIIIRPSWEPVDAEKNQIVITIDPGLAFGTGLHGTTKGVIILLEEIITGNVSVSEKSLLDAGTGSAILAITAHKLGIKKITAIDMDPESISTGKENVKINNIYEGIKLQKADLASHNGQYDIVLANIISEVLITNNKKIISFLKPHGTLIIAGLLDYETNLVLKAYEQKGVLDFVKKISIDNWCTLMLKLK